MAPLFLLNQITISISFVLVVPRGQALQRQALQRAPWTQRQMSLHHDFFVTRSSHQDRRHRLARAGNDSSTSGLTSLGIGTQLDIAPAAPTTLSSYTKRTKLERIRPVLKFSSRAITSRSRLLQRVAALDNETRRLRSEIESGQMRESAILLRLSRLETASGVSGNIL